MLKKYILLVITSFMRLLFRIWSKGELICCKCVLLSPTNYAHILWNQNISVSIFISKSVGHSCGDLPIVAFSKLSAWSILWSDNSPYGLSIKAFGQKGPGTNALTDRQMDKDYSNALLSRPWHSWPWEDYKCWYGYFYLLGVCLSFFGLYAINFYPNKIWLPEKKTAIKIQVKVYHIFIKC